MYTESQLDDQIFNVETGSSGSNCSVGELLEMMVSESGGGGGGRGGGGGGGGGTSWLEEVSFSLPLSLSLSLLSPFLYLCTALSLSPFLSLSHSLPHSVVTVQRFLT